MDAYKNKEVSLLVSEDEVKKIFSHYVGSVKIRDKTWKIVERTNLGGGFSDIYRIENDSGEKRILKVMSATRTVNGKSVYGCSQIFNAVYNELFAMRLFTNLNNPDGASASELKGYYEYKTEYSPEYGQKAEDWIFFIIMPEYETLGKCRIESEKEVYDLALDILRTLRVLHSEIEYKDIYNLFLNEHILSFDKRCFTVRKLQDYESARVLLHNDIKPKNILIKKIDGRNVAVLADYGAVRFLDPESDENKPEHGFVTDSFLDPLLRRNNLCIKKANTGSDLYSLGKSLLCIFYVAGSLSFKGITRYTEKFNKNVNDAINEFKNLKRPAYVSEIFWRIILKMITPYECDRFPNVDSAIEALEGIGPYISQDKFPEEAVLKAAIWNLINENNIKEVIELIFSDNPELDENPLFIKLRVFCMLSRADKIEEMKMTSDSFEKYKKALAPLRETGDEGAMFLYILAVIMAKERGIFDNDSEEVKQARALLKSLCDFAYPPAMHLYIYQAAQSNAYYRVTPEYIKKKFVAMLDAGYIPGIRYFKNRLEENPILFNYNDAERHQMLERIDSELKSNDMDDALAVLKSLLEYTDKSLSDHA